MLRLAVAGCTGKMGKTLVQSIVASENMRLTGATISPGHPLKDKDVGILAGVDTLQLLPQESLSAIADDFDVLIDFTTPHATMSHVEFCRQAGKKIVIGTTGFNAEQKQLIEEASQECAILMAPNMSLGVNACVALLRKAAQLIGADADIEIIEAHHRNKKDAPSGTALHWGEVICEELNTELDDVAVFQRNGLLAPRTKEQIGFSSLRAGDNIGEHTVMFSLPGERLEITHRALNRANYAKGALKAATWLDSKREGLFSMSDVVAQDNP